MRIALVLSGLAGGGSERVASTLVRYWSEAGHGVVIVTLDAAHGDAYDLPPEVQRIALDESRISTSYGVAIIRNLRRLKRIRDALYRCDADVIVSFQSRTNVLVLLAASGSGKPVVVSERTDPRFHSIPRTWSVLRGMIYRRAAALVVQTESVRQWGERLTASSRVHVIPNPIGIASISRVGSRARDTKRVVAMGRLVPEKGFDLLIDAFYMCSRPDDDWELHIFGEGPERKALLSQAAGLGIHARMSLPGFAADPATEFARADLFVLSSRYEGFPNVLTEAMACGVPVIAFSCPSGPAEIIRDRIEGILVEAGNAPALASAMRRVMDDESERSRLGAAAQQAVARFSPARVMREWESLIVGLTREQTAR